MIISIDNADETNSKSQIQNPKRALIIKIPISKMADATLVFEVWILGFGIRLGFWDWFLGFHVWGFAKNNLGT